MSKPVESNPMYGKKHSEKANKKISNRLSKHRKGVGIFDLKNNLIKNFKNIV